MSTEVQATPYLESEQTLGFLEQWLSLFGDSEARPSAEAVLRLVGQIAEMVPDAFWIISADHRVLYVNAAAEQIWGRPRAAFYEDPALFQKTLHPEDRELIFQTMTNAELERRTRLSFPEHRILRPDGAAVWVSVRVCINQDPSGKPQLVVGVAQDITARRKAQEELAQAKHAAEQANHAKDRFLAMLSHELRTPLTPVLASLSMPRPEPLVPATLLADLDMIRRNVELEARLIDDLLDLTRIAHGKLRMDHGPADVHELLVRAMDIVRPDADSKRLVIWRCFDASHSFVAGDASRLQQVFWNLLRNATQFTDSGGRIEVRTRSDAGAITIEVSDTGAGINPAFLPRLFDVFEQEGRSKRKGGLGLGLAIAKTIIDIHAGTISASSPGIGKGACFTIVLPLMHPSSQELAVRREHQSITVRPLRIALVEDHVTSLQVLTRILRQEGHHVTPAASVQEATHLLLQERPDLLIADIGLPDGSGLELLQTPHHQGLRAIALSGYGMEHDVAASRAAGFKAHLTKPVDTRRLLSTIAEVMSQ